MNPNLIGPAESRNFGVQISKGQWVCFLDDDDAFSLEFFANFKNILNSELADVFYSNFIKVEEDRNHNEFISSSSTSLQNTPIELLMIRNFIPNSCILVKNHLAKNVHFDLNLKSHEDWDWLINLKMRSDFKHINILGPIIYESISDSRNMNSLKNHDFIYDYLNIYRKWPTSDSFAINARHQVLMHHGLSVSIDILR
jgi:glycosyltransferase involved in cell wall biosynthesis